MKRFRSFLLQKDKKSGKKGFSLSETAIALTLLGIVFAMTITAVLSVSTSYKNVENSRYFITEIENYLECYKMDGVSGFAENVNDYLLDDNPSLEIDVSRASSDNSYQVIVCYDSDFNKIEVLVSGGGIPGDLYSHGKYFVRIILNNSFYAVAFDDRGNTIFDMKDPYYSRYDL